MTEKDANPAERKVIHSVHLDPPVADRVREAAEARKTTMGRIMEEAIVEWLTDYPEEAAADPQKPSRKAVVAVAARGDRPSIEESEAFMLASSRHLIGEYATTRALSYNLRAYRALAKAMEMDDSKPEEVIAELVKRIS